jgi:hypothetical protein
MATPIANSQEYRPGSCSWRRPRIIPVASCEASYLTGAIINVDGGFEAQFKRRRSVCG